MEYYDYYDFDDEINIAVREYKNTKGEVEILQTEIDELQKKQGVLIEEKNKETNDILKRKYDREISDNLNEIKQRDEKIKGIRENIQGKIDIAKEKLSKKLEEKDSKIEMSEKNVEAVRGQLDTVKTQIEEIKSKSDKELSQAIKESMLMGLESKQAEYEKMMEEFMKNSETLTLEKMDVEELDTKLSLSNMDNFIELWDRVTQESVKVQNPVMSTPDPTQTKPEPTPTTPDPTQTKPGTTQTTPDTTQTKPGTTQTKPKTTKTTPDPTQTKPGKTQTTPDPTQTKPGTTQTKPNPTQTTPDPTQTKPGATQRTPDPTQTKPGATQTKPGATKTKPDPTQTKPGSKDSLKNLKEIKIGKDGVVLFNRDATYYLGETTAFDFKDMKDAYKGYGKGEYEKEEIINDLITENSLSQEIIDNMDPVILEAIKYQKDHKMILKEEAEAFVSMYTSALNGDKDSQKMLKDIITYDRRGMDYLKPSNIFDRIRNRKAFKEFRKFAGSHENFSKIIPDEPGKIRGLLSNIPGIKRLFKKKENPQLLNQQQTQTTPDPTQTKPKEATIDYETAEKLMNTARAFKNMSSSDLAKTSGLDYRKDVPHVDVPKKNIREEVKVDAQTAENIKAVEESFKNMSSRDLLKPSGLDYRKDVPHVDVPKKNEGIDK